MKQIWNVLSYLYDRFFEDGCPHLGASLAYSTLLSLVPVATVGFSILSVFPFFKGFGLEIQQFILSNFVAASANVISVHLQSFVQQMHDLTAVNFLVLLIFSILMIYNMVHAFNQIWHVKMQRHYALTFVIYLGILLVTPVCFGVVMLVSAYLGSLSIMNHITTVHYIKAPALVVVPYFAAFITFTFFNWVLPSTRVYFRYAALSGFVTMILFEFAKFFFVLYLTYFPTYRLIYGALAIIPIFLVWMYVCWLIILLGALFCHTLQEKSTLFT